ncbi:MAG: tRNA lysidine(34) synthetase TilS [Saprospiraceae bacterium]|nr:tRNA lysidine(34) synthetase TilS [Saprospiraceae bacterium]
MQAFEAFLTDQSLLSADERVLLALSGGLDSVVLGHLLHRSGRPFGVAHCNFQLRGEASDADAAFVHTFADQWAVPYFETSFEAKTYAAQNGLSLQEAARNLRYDWLETIRTSQGFSWLLTGHHLNDSLETAILHFIRGTGLTGLAGIPLRNGSILRPMLFATRDDIFNYAQNNNLSWREDSSNATDAYTRNAIRHHILPRMLDINPSLLSSAARTLQHLRATDNNLRFLLHEWLGNPEQTAVLSLEKAKLVRLPALADALFELLQPCGFYPEQVRQMAEHLNQSGQEWLSPQGYRLLNHRDALLLTRQAEEPETAGTAIAEDDLLLRLPDGSRLALLPVPAGSPMPEDRHTILVNAGPVKFPLLLRRWQAGDRFQPLGMGGNSQKLQDFFTNQKVSKLEKENAWVLVNGDAALIWVLGMRLDERFKIETDTTKLLKITWLIPS